MISSFLEKSWILPIQILVRRWRIPLTDHERNLLEYALCNASDELIRYPFAGVTLRIHQGTVVLLFGLPKQDQIDSGLEHCCHQIRMLAKKYFYAEVEIGIGETVWLRELPEESDEEAGSEMPALKQNSESELDQVPCMRKTHYSDDILQQILKYIEEHLPEQMTRDDIAQCVHFHPAYLSRFFRKKTGWSLSEYIMQRRIESAKQMLTHSELRIGHIMNRLGYCNLSHFTRTFKKQTGYTPIQYRRNIL